LRYLEVQIAANNLADRADIQRATRGAVEVTRKRPVGLRVAVLDRGARRLDHAVGVRLQAGSHRHGRVGDRVATVVVGHVVARLVGGRDVASITVDEERDAATLRLDVVVGAAHDVGREEHVVRTPAHTTFLSSRISCDVPDGVVLVVIELERTRESQSSREWQSRCP